MAGRQVGFKTTATDEEILAAIGRTAYGRLAKSALLRFALERLAVSLGVWGKEGDPAEPSKGEVAISLQARD